jgi:hypothetical protein
MTVKHKILIVDSTTNRREDLCRLWSVELGYDVVYTGGVDLYEFPNTQISLDDLMKTPPKACLLHQSDLHIYDEEEWRKLLDSCGRVVVFGGAGIPTKGAWPARWSWIPRAVEGKGSAKNKEWKQLADWFSSDPSLTIDQIDLLHRVKQPRFLIAIHILCQGFLVAQRMRERVPTAVEQTRTRNWWSVPLIESARDKLMDTVRAEWGPDMPESISTLVKWISEERGIENVDLASLVPEIKQAIENRLTK